MYWEPVEEERKESRCAKEHLKSIWIKGKKGRKKQKTAENRDEKHRI